MSLSKTVPSARTASTSPVYNVKPAKLMREKDVPSRGDLAIMPITLIVLINGPAKRKPNAPSARMYGILSRLPNNDTHCDKKIMIF